MNESPVTQAEAKSGAAVACSALFGDNPPNDGREYDCQCARCGSSVQWEQCGACGGEGITGPGELYEQDPLWYDMDDYEPCHQCNGDASWGICLSSPEWCEAHPLPGREDVKRGTIEWYALSPNAEVSEGGTRDSRIETAVQSRPSLH